eukprot:jgi/Ulvmu1/3458/UM016_0078.1
MPTLRVAVNGCSHGELDTIYATIEDIGKKTGRPIDLFISCGDFQAMRNVDDLHCFSAPPKYRAMKDFHKYYSGDKTAPVPTLFVGGNHEAANHMHELYYGGWAAPNIFYMGAAGVVNFGGLRIGGLTGIYKEHDYTSGHHELPPYDRSTVRSAYHVRDLDVYRLLKVREEVDVMVSHDWPTVVPRYGNTGSLLRCKPFFTDEVNTDTLGSPASWHLLQAMKPRYWFSGHLHVAFSAAVPHGPDGVLPPGDASAQRVTRFMAVDKPLPKRTFVQVIDIPVRSPGPNEVWFDEEWLAILRETHGMMNLSRGPTRFPTAFASPPATTAEHRSAVAEALQAAGGAAVPADGFARTVDPSKRGQGAMPTSIPRNPQTEAVLRLIGKPWNLGGNGGDGIGSALATAAAAPLTGADLLGDDGPGNGASGDAPIDIDAMFQPVDIHNMDPHAISDAKIKGEAAAFGVGDSGSTADASASLHNPEEIDIDLICSSDDG